jgi:heme/copper-type cytochrome/quinol oxidase subunit 2
MFKNLKNIKQILNNLKYRIPVIQIIIVLILIDLRLLFNSTINELHLMKYETPFYDIGTLMSYLICLEHIYVTYYLIIIIVMVYWCLYIFIIDFASWSNKTYKKNILNNLFFLIINFIILNIVFIFNFLYRYLLKIFKEYLDFKALSNLTVDKKFKTTDLNFLSLNNIIFKTNNKYSILNNYIYLMNNKYMYFEYILYKKINNFLYNNKPKYIYYLTTDINIFTEKNINKMLYNDFINKIRNNYNYVFNLNQFRHSGVFEGVWAFFPTIIILLILIPSLILIYSFEDIINPKLSVKVIGNQWYWTYEMDSWLEYKNNNNTEFNLLINKNKEIRYDLNSLNEANIYYLWKDKRNYSLENFIYNLVIRNKDDILNNNILENFLYNTLIKNNFIYLNEKDIKLTYCTFSFDSVIKDIDSLNLGEKRLLEVDNRLILSTNETIRYLITAADVLHSFNVPELGLKVDAVPGRLNQLLSFINRPGIYYGHVLNYVV